MSDILGFPPHIAALILTVGGVYMVLSWAPLWWPAITTWRQRHVMPRRLLFILVVASISYGVFVLLFFTLAIPFQLYAVYVAPTWEQLGYPTGHFLLTLHSYFESLWWVFLPPTLLAATFLVNRKLALRWTQICSAIEG